MDNRLVTPESAIPGHLPGPVDPSRAQREITAALDDLTAALPSLALADHHDRYVAVLEVLQGVLDEVRPPRS